MIEFKKDTWEEFVCNFAGKLSVGYTIEDALKNFLKDYWTELDVLSREAGLKDDEEEESLDVCIDRMMKPMWDYVYNLNREISKLKADVALLKESNAAKQYPLPIGGPGQKYPNNIPPTHDYPLDWYKVTAHSNAKDNQRIPGLIPEGFATSGYMQVVDPKYTQEQMEEWAGLRFNDPTERR
jgi:hypothetical protein